MHAQPATETALRHRAWIRYMPLVLACVAFAAYSGSLRGPWILDDQMLIAHNPLVQHPQFVGKLWTSEYWASTGAPTNLYRPLPMTTYAVTYWLTGGSTFPQHLTNVGLHCLATILVWWVCGGAVRGSAADAAALLFAVHPVHVEAVANVVGRSELLVAVFFLAALLLHRRFLTLTEVEASSDLSPTRAAAYGFGVALLMLCAFFSKESAVPLLLYFPVAHILSGRAHGSSELKTMVVFHLPLAGALILYLGMRALATGGTTLAAGPGGLGQHVVLSASAAAKNIQLLLLPIQQKAVWPLPKPGAIHMWLVAVGLLAMLSLGLVPLAGAMVALRRGQIRSTFVDAILAVSLLGLSLLPLLHIVPNVIWVWERGLYLPSAALCWLICIGVSSAAGHRRLQLAGYCILVTLVAAAFPRTLWLDRLYADDLRFWSYQAAHSPNDVNAMVSLSESLLRSGRTGEALRLRERAYERQPERGALVTALASLYMKVGERSLAAEVLTSASLTRLDFHTAVQRQQTLQILYRMSQQLDLSSAAERFLTESRKEQ